jgi:tRNA (guanine9-N1)-methyltransferase
VQGNETFIVGGLVDRTIVKNATLYRSRGLGVRACRLPISHLIKPNFKKALNVCTAALMIPEYLTHRDWERTFNEIVPKKFT